MRTYDYHSHHIIEHRVPGKRLGRHVGFDSRSLAYPYRPETTTLVSALHNRNIPILDQGDVGSCTGNAMVGGIGTDPLYGDLAAGFSSAAAVAQAASALSAGTMPALDEAEALAIYSAAEVIDGDGPYPPNDDGSCGLSVCKAAKNAGLIAGYTHCQTANSALLALGSGPVLFGISWYDSFDEPDSSGLVVISPDATVRGGHEIVARGIDVDAYTIYLDNSWGTGWGVSGSFTMGWATLERLLSEYGDAVVPVGAAQPAPVAALPSPAVMAAL